MQSQAPIQWLNSTPGMFQLFILEDPQQKETTGGVILTEKLPEAAEVGFYTGTIYKAGKYAHLLMGFPKPFILTNLRVVYRQYLSQALRFKEKVDGKNAFIIRAEDIVAFVEEGVRVDGI